MDPLLVLQQQGTNLVEGVGSFSNYIAEYGPLTVILAVFLLLFLLIAVYIVKSHQSSVQHDRDMNTEIVTSILNDYFAKNNRDFVEVKKQDYDEKKIVDIFVKLNKALKSACEDTATKLNSDRTAIYVFHNGTQASHGLPFFKMTCISEWASQSSSLNIKMSDHGSMPLNIYDSIVTKLYEDSEYRIIKSQISEPGDLMFLKNTKIQDCFFIPIYDEDNSMMGFIFNGYNIYDPERDITKEKECLISLADIAKPVIEFSKFQEYKSNEKE